MAKNILFLTPQVPYPPTGGGVCISYRVLMHLNSQHSVTVFSFDKTGNDEVNRKFRAVVGHDRVRLLRFKRDRTASSYLRSILAGKPLAIYRNYSAKAMEVIKQLAENADIIYVDHYLMFQYVPSTFRGKVVVFAHNAEHVMWSRAAECSRALLRWPLKLEAIRVRSYETHMLYEADAILAFRNDAQEFRSMVKTDVRLFETLPFGEEENLHRPPLEFDSTLPVLAFIGTLSWQANSDGIKWFLRSIWPKVRRAVPEAEVWIAGTGGSKEVEKELTSFEGVKYLGFVDDLEDIYRRARIFIAPLRFGSGIKIKVLNALYRGLPVVTTPCGAEGLGLDNGRQAWIADDPTQFAASVVRTLTESDLWARMANAAREFASLGFSGPMVMKAIDEVLSVES